MRLLISYFAKLSFENIKVELNVFVILKPSSLQSNSNVLLNVSNTSHFGVLIMTSQFCHNFVTILSQFCYRHRRRSLAERNLLLAGGRGPPPVGALLHEPGHDGSQRVPHAHGHGKLGRYGDIH